MKKKVKLWGIVQRVNRGQTAYRKIFGINCMLLMLNDLYIFCKRIQRITLEQWVWISQAPAWMLTTVVVWRRKVGFATLSNLWCVTFRQEACESPVLTIGALHFDRFTQSISHPYNFYESDLWITACTNERTFQLLLLLVDTHYVLIRLLYA